MEAFSLAGRGNLLSWASVTPRCYRHAVLRFVDFIATLTTDWATNDYPSRSRSYDKPRDRKTTLGNYQNSSFQEVISTHSLLETEKTHLGTWEC